VIVLKRLPLPFVEESSNSRPDVLPYRAGSAGVPPCPRCLSRSPQILGMATDLYKLANLKYHQRGIAIYLDRRIWFVPHSSNLATEDLDKVQVNKESCLQKFFSTFPSEWAGVGLFLLRALVGCSLIAQGVGYAQAANQSLVALGLAIATFAGGAFLLAGLMTPVIAILVAAGGIGIAFSWIPSTGLAVLDSYLAIINLIVLSIAIALLGPGAFSLDARMFGRREITIPSCRDAQRP